MGKKTLAVLILLATLFSLGSCEKKDREKIYVLRPDWYGVVLVSADGSEDILSFIGSLKHTDNPTMHGFPALDGDKLYFVSDDGMLESFSFSGGSKERWPLPEGFSQPQYIVPYENGACIQLKTANDVFGIYWTSSEGWEFVAPSSVGIRPFAVADGAIYCQRAGKKYGELELIRADISSGEIKTICDDIGTISSIAVFDDRVFVGYWDYNNNVTVCSSYDADKGGNKRFETPIGPIVPEEYTDELRRQYPTMGNFVIHDGWFYFYEPGETETAIRLAARRISDGKLVKYFTFDHPAPHGADYYKLFEQITFGESGFVFADGIDSDPCDEVDTVEFRYYPYKK